MKASRYSFLLFKLSFIMVACDEQSEQNDHPAISDDYLGIFKNMPLLYEYIIDTLTKKPEVLEFSQSYYTDANVYDYYKRNNDEEVNNDDTQQRDDTERTERSEREENDNGKFKTENDVSANSEYNIATNAKTIDKDYDNAVNKREDNNGNECGIDPQEIIEKAMWVEDQLEKYNDKR